MIYNRQQGQHQEYEDAVASGSQFMSPYLVLRVRREHLVMDTISHFVAFTDNDFKKPLKVHFASLHFSLHCPVRVARFALFISYSLSRPLFR
jgi:hypothetical protein